MRKAKALISALMLSIAVGMFTAAYIQSKGTDVKFLVRNILRNNKFPNDKKPQPIKGKSHIQEGTALGNPVKQNGDTVRNASPQSNGRNKRIENIKVRAVYLTGGSAGNKQILGRIVELSKNTELNSVVIDIKEGGMVNYMSNVLEVKRNNAYHPLYDVDGVIKTLHDNNIYIIGRIVCFRDPVLAEKRVDLAVKSTNGQIWREGRTAWTNPYNEEVWKYNIDIAREAVEKGFDEIQFDYVRFPTARNSELSYGSNVPAKADAICKFLEMAQKRLHDEMGAAVSADVFGIICESGGDTEDIGQVLEKMGKDIDSISPMLYPSHFANASYGINGNGVGQVINGILFAAPDLSPYEVVYNALVKTKNRLSGISGYKAKIRPYLQAFTASYLSSGYYQRYTAVQIRQQIKAVYDAGYSEWILWDPNNAYPADAFEKRQ